MIMYVLHIGVGINISRWHLFYDFRFLRMRDFDLSKSKEMFLNYLKWREDFGVDAISKVSTG